MKRLSSLLAPAFLAVAVASTNATVIADDKPADAPKLKGVAIAVTTKTKDGPRPHQVPQYGLASELAQWGLEVESRVATPWDKHLEKAKIKVAVPPKKAEGEKKDEKKDEKPPAPTTAFTVEGTIELIYNPTRFYADSNDRELTINYIAKVDVSVKDEKGKEIKKIAWQNYWGTNNDAGHEAVMGESEKRATRFIIHDLLRIQEIAAQIPKEKEEKLKTFLESEAKYREAQFDDFTKHKLEGDDGKK